jgi:hypothetical protein
VLGLPPAFNLSHDQTLQFKVLGSQPTPDKPKPISTLFFNVFSFEKDLTQGKQLYFKPSISPQGNPKEQCRMN